MNNKQLSLLISGLSMALVVSLLFTIQLGGPQEDEYVIEMNLDEDLEELIEEEKEQLQQLQAQNQVKSHSAFNEAMDARSGDPEPFKTLEELEQELAELESEDQSAEGEGVRDEAYEEYLRKLAERRKALQEQLDERESEKNNRTANLKDKQTSVSYSMVERDATYLPIPIYKCIEGGKIVINVVVNANGDVIDASFNTNSSTSSNGCLVDEAISYALRSGFQKSDRPKQLGTITYLFQHK